MAAGSTPPAGGWAGSRSSTRPAIPAGVASDWLDDQIGAMTFDREGLRVLQVDWVARRPGAADPVDGSDRIDRTLPVTDTRRWPRGDFVFSRDGERLAAPTRRDPTVVGVWDVALGRPVVVLRGSGGLVTAVAFGPDGQVAGDRGGRRAERAADRDPLAPGLAPADLDPRGGAGPVTCPGFQRGRPLARGGRRHAQEAPGWVTAWDAETGAVLGTLDRVGLVMSLAFHPDGRRLAVADYGGSKVHLWDIAAGTLITHPGPRASVASDSPRTGSGWPCWATTAMSTWPTPGPATRCWCSAAWARPPAAGGYTPRMAFSPDGSRIVANATD